MIKLNTNADQASYDISTEVGINLSKVATVDKLYYENESNVDIKCGIRIKYYGVMVNNRPAVTANIKMRPRIQDTDSFAVGEDSEWPAGKSQVLDDGGKINVLLPYVILPVGKFLYLTIESDDGGDSSIGILVDIWDVSDHVGYASNGKPQVDAFTVGGNTPAVPPTNWSGMVIDAMGRILSGFSRNN